MQGKITGGPQVADLANPTGAGSGARRRSDRFFVLDHAVTMADITDQQDEDPAEAPTTGRVFFEVVELGQHPTVVVVGRFMETMSSHW